MEAFEKVLFNALMDVMGQVWTDVEADNDAEKVANVVEI